MWGARTKRIPRPTTSQVAATIAATSPDAVPIATATRGPATSAIAPIAGAPMGVPPAKMAM